ncbi:hypothetical protein O3M35_000751 [Rhynocoris fuscipes]|uniref:RNA-polymerase II-associated protein 3-like C-terminal domain-containing protein n=1 Tax=Rhynocoris fuscipes TaxID=488301 RepID=A0AAW1DT97_9HEMI
MRMGKERKQCLNEGFMYCLQSKETGHYPELTECAENRLKELSPNNKLLRKAVPALKKDFLDKSEKSLYLKEIEEWKDDMEAKETGLKSSSTPNYVLQPVRRTTGIIENSEESNDKKKEDRIKSYDYQSWDNYDADKECLRMDLEEEKRREEKERLERMEKEREKAREQMTIEEAEIDAIKDHVYNMTPEEREVLALKEKDIGNEFYKTHHLDEAIKHYTRSVYIYPTVSNHNNRAATYLKQCKFSKALADLNIVLKMDPNNVKARYRRAVAYQHKNEFQKALEDIRVVLAKEPHHVLARHLADRLREDVSTLPKKHRLKVRNNTGETHVEEVTEEEMLTNYKDKNFIEINEFGLPKIMCNCNGKYVNEPGIRHEDNIRYQHLRQRKQYEQNCSYQQNNTPLALPAAPVQPVETLNGPKSKPLLAGGGRRLDIVELDSICEESEESQQTSCLIRDMRSTKDEKTTANINIAQATTSVADSSASLTNQTAIGEFDKSDKTIWNESVKESEGEGEDEDSEELKNIHEDVKILDDISTSANIDEVMEAAESLPTSTYQPLNEDDTWSDQWLQNSVSSVNSDFGKCMDLNKNNNLNFGLGDACDVILKQTPLLNGCRCSLNLDSLKPQNFLELWCGTNQGLSPNEVLRSKAILLKGVCPMHVPEVFSLNVNEAILTDLINCLCYFYKQNYSREILLDYALAISKLQRFHIIYLFVAEDVKKKIRTLFKRIGPLSDDLQRAFKTVWNKSVKDSDSEDEDLKEFKIKNPDDLKILDD